MGAKQRYALAYHNMRTIGFPDDGEILPYEGFPEWCARQSFRKRDWNVYPTPTMREIRRDFLALVRREEKSNDY